MERTPLVFRASATFDETAATEAVDVSAFEELIFKTVTTEEAGTSTLDIIIQDSDDGTTWNTHTTLSQITANGTVITRLDKFLRYVRMSITLGGTSFTLAVTGWGIKRQ